MKAAAERSGFAPVKNAEVYGSLAAASFVYRFHFLLGPGAGRRSGRLRGVRSGRRPGAVHARQERRDVPGVKNDNDVCIFRLPLL